MGRACGTHRTEEKCVQNFGGKTWGNQTTCIRPSVHGKVILKRAVSRYVGRSWSQSASG